VVGERGARRERVRRGRQQRERRDKDRENQALLVCQRTKHTSQNTYLALFDDIMMSRRWWRGWWVVK
jgi:hypothetical protein